MCKENLYAKMEKLDAQVCKCTRQGLKVYALLRKERRRECDRRVTACLPHQSVESGISGSRK